MASQIIDHPPKRLQIGRPLYNDNHDNHGPQILQCLEYHQLSRHTPKGAILPRQILQKSPGAAPQSLRLLVVGGPLPGIANFTFQAIYRGYTITPFIYNDPLRGPHLVVINGWFKLPGVAVPRRWKEADWRIETAQWSNSPATLPELVAE